MADALRQAVSQPAGAAPGEQRQAGDDPARYGRGRLCRPRLRQGRAVHRPAHAQRHQDRAHQHCE